jgi:formate--tetrahydrofolate ligase
LPAIVIAQMLGVPPIDRHLFKEWSDLITALVFGAYDNPDRFRSAARGMMELKNYLLELINKFEKNPEDNLISLLLEHEDGDSLLEKMRKVATKIYGAADISASAKVKQQLKTWEEAGYGSYPICVAKTQSSFSSDATLRGAPSGHVVNVREVKLAAGAQFIVMICGDIMTMPGLPKVPSAEKIDIDEEGNVVGLF